MRKTKAQLMAENESLKVKVNSLLGELRDVRKDLMTANYQLIDAIRKTFDAQREAPYVRH